MPDWLTGIAGADRLPTTVLSLAFVVALVFVLFWLARRVFSGGAGIGSRSKTPRLAVLDVTSVDPKRKLVLIRRDQIEHLLLIGGQNDLVVESDIGRVSVAPPGGRVDPSIQQGLHRGETQPVSSVPSVAPPRDGPRRPVAPPPRPLAREPRAASSPTRERLEVGSLGMPQPALPALAEVAPERRSTEPEDLTRTDPAAAERLPTDTVAARAPHFQDAETVLTSEPSVAQDLRGSFAPDVAERATSPEAGSIASPEQTASIVPPASTPPAIEPPTRRVPTPQPRAEQQVTVARTRVPTSPPLQRSMATPTLPSASAARQPSPNVLRPSDMTDPADPSAIVVSQTDTGITSRSSPETEMVPMVQTPAPDERLLASPDIVAHAAQNRGEGQGDLEAARAADHQASARAEQPSASEAAPPAQPSHDVDPPARQPLSVRSFASTIQARRSMPAKEPASLAAPVQPVEPAEVDDSLADLLAAEFAPSSNKDPATGPSQVADQSQRAEPGALEPEPTRIEATASRPLSLEEEMERLLKDFSVGVSHRR